MLFSLGQDMSGSGERGRGETHCIPLCIFMSIKAMPMKLRRHVEVHPKLFRNLKSATWDDILTPEMFIVPTISDISDESNPLIAQILCYF